MSVRDDEPIVIPEDFETVEDLERWAATYPPHRQRELRSALAQHAVGLCEDLAAAETVLAEAEDNLIDALVANKTLRAMRDAL